MKSVWEQASIEILTSKEMGEWLARRDKRMLDRIKKEIENKADYYDELINADIAEGLYMAVEIIDKVLGEVGEQDG